MKGDFSRVTFDPTRQFSRVLLQQGRVLLDPDWNEQAEIFQYQLRTLAAALIGPHGGPKDNLQLVGGALNVRARRCGFDVIVADDQIDRLAYLSTAERNALKAELAGAGNWRLLVSAGRYYVDGIPVLNPQDVTYLKQPYPPVPGTERDRRPATAFHLLYLDIWERHRTGLEVADLLELALGGADTTTRAQVIWQVRFRVPPPNSPHQIDGTTDVEAIWAELVEEWQPRNRGRLRATAHRHQPGAATEPCLVAPDARFRGEENHLYRVEIHRGGPAWDGAPGTRAGAATFKWSRDNGTVVAAWDSTAGDTVFVSGVRDELRGFSPGQWVELTDDFLELRGEPGILALVQQVEDNRLSIDPATAPAVEADPARRLRFAKVRRWDQEESGQLGLHEGAVSIQEERWIELEDGVMVQFAAAAAGGRPHVYRSGDYWLIPARESIGDVVWPKDAPAGGGEPQPRAVPPHGVEHHFAPLAVVQGPAADNHFTLTRDLRRAFAALATSPAMA